METRTLFVEIVRSFSFKLNAGNYESRDFFCSQKAECPLDEAEAVSERLHGFCKREVVKAVAAFQAERATGEPVIQIQPATRKSAQMTTPVPAPGPAASVPSPAPSAVVIPFAAYGGDTQHSSNGNGTAVPTPSIGVIVDVIERPTGSIVKLSTGVQCGTRDAALIRAAILLKEAQTPVECVTRPPADPKYAPTLTELRPQATNGGGA